MSVKHITNTPTRLAVIGAGPSGLALSLFLNNSPEILEAQAHVGGHASSFMAKGFTFDYGPHILFSRDQQILDFIVASLGDNVSRCRRNNKISYKNRIMKYPFENDLKSLELEDNYDCISHFIFNPYKEKYAVPANMKEWFLKTFGEGICSHYLFPYNEKIWNIPVERLSMSMASRIPNPPPEDILKSSLGYSTEGYLHQLYYFYPKTGGYQAISEAWKKTLVINYGFRVDRIQFDQGKIRLFDEQSNMKEYEQVVSTMPVHEIISKMDIEIPNEIRAAVEKLIVNPMFVISFGVAGVDPNQYTAVYFPEAEFLVNRISYPCTFSAANGPEGHWSLQAEITCARSSSVWQQSDAEILAHAKQGLQQRNLLPGDEQIVFEQIDRVDQSYVVYDVGYEANAEKVRTWFASIGIHLLGRFSYFEYVNVDMAVARAIKVAAFLNGEPDNEATKERYLAKALSILNED
ncbi:protoporphyrinogen oxidase [Legionella massiliensis]|uniref:Protoporphyrinogen oxidase n=1 Tax=Legionella massiliensis TaxID=1034943 RepID=A0A078KX99_9GAMM|nr:NAD(P)-binding protein [Legionella massiliensis]CDZ77601.1 protoporphyrinogen oxidase [Legionella massiliensis]CEE13339.1 UDP-galactopyranose mutase [Legionella massiliensis]